MFFIHFSFLFSYKKIKATDQDSGADGRISFAIISGNQAGLFAITQDGNITVNGILDRETIPTFILTIEASDNPFASAKKTSNTVNVAVALKDVNDNKPIFNQQQQCVAYVSDDAPLSSEVTTIGATDLDEGLNQQLEYRLTSNSDSAYFSEYFTFSDLSAGIFVKRSLDLNRQNLTSKQIQFEVFAMDTGVPSLNASISCQLVIQGENKNAPTLAGHAPEEVVTIPSKAIAGEYVLKVNATDRDFGPNGQLQFAITHGNEDGVFTISSSTGRITLTKKPTSAFYLIRVNISDSGSVIKRKSITFDMYAYYEGVELVAGQVNIGEKLSTPPFAALVSKDDEITLPMYIHVGMTPLEAFDVTIKYPASQLTFARFSSAALSVVALNTTQGVRLVGRVALTKTPIGVVKVGELTFQGLPASSSHDSIQLSALVQSIHNQFANYIPLSSAPPSTCSEAKVFGDATQDCLFTVADYAYCNSYIRHKSGGFKSPKAAKFTSMSSAQKSMLDSNKDSLITTEDCDYFFSVLTGDSVPFGEVLIRIPDHRDHQGSCVLSTTVKLDQSATSSVLADLTSTFIVLTYTDASFLKNSHVANTDNNANVLASFNSSGVYGDVIQMGRSGNTFQFKTVIEYLPTTVGLTLGMITTNRVTGIQKVTTLFRKNSHQQSQKPTQVSIGSEGVVMPFSIGYIAQQSVSMKETTLRCQNPLKVTTLIITFDNDFKSIVQNYESEFKSWFVTFYQDRELNKYSREVTVTNVRVTEGSIIVEFDVQHLQADQSALIADLKTDIKDGTLTAAYNSTILVPKKTLLVDGHETLGDRRDKDSTWIYVVIIIICCIVFILVTMVICLVYLKHKKRNKVMTDRSEDYELTEKQSSFDNKVMVQTPKMGKGYDENEGKRSIASQSTEFELVALTPLEVVSFPYDSHKGQFMCTNSC